MRAPLIPACLACSPLSLTHGVQVAEGLVHADDFVVQLIIAVGVGQEGVAICDKQVEHIHNLKQEEVSE